MYVVFEDGSRQYTVSENDVVRLDYRPGEAGSQVLLERVLLAKDGDAVEIGKPTLSGMRVAGEIVEQTSEKYMIGKFRRRKNYRRLKGHRQPYTKVRILKLLKAGEQPPAPKPKTEPAPPAQTPAPTA